MSCSIPEPSEPTSTVPPVPSSRMTGEESLAQMTTIAVGGKAARVVTATTEDELVDTIAQADHEGTPVLVLGGGSNVLASDEPFDGVVVRDGRREITTLGDDGCGGAQLRATAGTPWDDVVVYAVEHGWMGVEALSGIPGSVGAAPVQNIGAYGQEIAETLASVRVYDRAEKRIRTLFLSDLKFGYRDSILKRSIGKFGASPRYIVLSVELHLRRATLSRPVGYSQLAGKLGIDLGERAPSSDVRAAVLELRRSKGMVLEDADRDTYSLGSFFTNPVLTEAEAAQLPEEAPRFGVAKHDAVNQIGAAAPQIPGQVKTSAAWLIDHAGFHAGYNMPGPAALSTKHCLALTNRGGASAADIVRLAREVRDGVQARFGVRLVPEPVLVGLEI
ncbi:UDP-N-acetylmuramate dehydrogenase [Trueperella bialowiezensis]|uniref:UDP-N-acetylenolpyruvoylglucosamine reductase n=1 Tax=Trueperella bialowiezensis TaxID=312285 RepID=A0A3S4V9Z9_9ACTO|nr:UDP-N-acetylmuramate dehydrogenase [Trueperella bialowiezensis]VEI12883.1 UDP-N-acetylenolpyruvoylglucosamine reductase [Trueperella bialowiezensis]